MASITSNIRTVSKRINFFIRRTPAAATSVIEDFANRVRERMNVRKPVSYPIQWDSEKQRRAFFATNGFGNGIPYSRTGDLAWTVSKPFENEVNLFAPHPAGPVFGYMPDGSAWQSKIHRGTWPAIIPVLTDEMRSLPSKIMDRLRVLLGEAGSVK